MVVPRKKVPILRKGIYFPQFLPPSYAASALSVQSSLMSVLCKMSFWKRLKQAAFGVSQESPDLVGIYPYYSRTKNPIAIYDLVLEGERKLL